MSRSYRKTITNAWHCHHSIDGWWKKNGNMTFRRKINDILQEVTKDPEYEPIYPILREVSDKWNWISDGGLRYYHEYQTCEEYIKSVLSMLRRHYTHIRYNKERYSTKTLIADWAKLKSK